MDLLSKSFHKDMEGIEEQEIPQPAQIPEGIPERPPESEPPEQIVEDLKDEITKDIESSCEDAQCIRRDGENVRSESNADLRRDETWKRREDKLP